MSSSSEFPADIIRRQQRDFLQIYEAELRHIGEAAGGLYGLINGEPDYSCFAAKRLFGKRDKNWGSARL